MFSLLFTLIQLLRLAKAQSDIGPDFIRIKEDQALLGNHGTLDVVIGIHFGMPRQKCADICRHLGDDSCTGFTTSQITRVCILYRRANSDAQRSQQEFFLKRRPADYAPIQNSKPLFTPKEPDGSYEHGHDHKHSHEKEQTRDHAKFQRPSKQIQIFQEIITKPPIVPVVVAEYMMKPSLLVRGYTEFSVNCLGNTLSGHKNMLVVSDCARLCDFIDDCAGFSYAKELKDCFLKATGECENPTGENSPFKFFRKEKMYKLKRLRQGTYAPSADDIVAMVDSLVEADDRPYQRRTPPPPLLPRRPKYRTTLSEYLRTPRPPRHRIPQPRPPMPVTTWRTPATTTTTTMRQPIQTTVPQYSYNRKLPPGRQFSLFTPLNGNCPEHTIGELLPLQYPQCAKLCDNHPACRGFAYSAVGPGCVLKSRPCHDPVASEYTFYARVENEDV